mgnify:CR=1 FL=1
MNNTIGHENMQNVRENMIGNSYVLSSKGVISHWKNSSKTWSIITKKRLKQTCAFFWESGLTLDY